MISVTLALAVVLFTVIFILTTAHWYAACDIGINASAKAFWLFLLVAPVMFLLLSLAASGSYVFERRVVALAGTRLLLFSLVGMAVCLVCAFAFQLWDLRDYPNPNGCLLM